MALDLDVIRSKHNPALKRVGAILAGKELGGLVLEGDRLVDDALRAGHGVELVLVAADRVERAKELADRAGSVRLVEPGLLDRVSALRTSPGVLGVTTVPASLDPAELEATGDGLVLVVAGMADPGNLGALARTAEAAGARAILCLDGGASPWNPKALRGSMGSLLRLPVAFGQHATRVAGMLAEGGWRSVTAATRGGARPDAFDWSGDVALWVTGETGAAPDEVTGFQGVTIPMAGDVESLNVTVAASLLLFAAGRVR